MNEASPALVADIGGTNVRFALARRAAGGVSLDAVRAYAVAEFDSLIAAAAHYLQACDARPGHAVLAAAGPVRRETQRVRHVECGRSLRRHPDRPVEPAVGHVDSSAVGTPSGTRTSGCTGIGYAPSTSRTSAHDRVQP